MCYFYPQFIEMSDILFGGWQKHFDSLHLFRHSTNSSWSLQNLITYLSTQGLAKSISCDQYFA